MRQCSETVCGWCAAKAVGAKVECGDREMQKTMQALQVAGTATYEQYKNVGISSLMSGSAWSTMSGARAALTELTMAMTAEELKLDASTMTQITERMKTRRTASALVQVCTGQSWVWHTLCRVRCWHYSCCHMVLLYWCQQP